MLTRFEKNPILTPTPNWWEQYLVFNPGAAIFDDKIYMLYRAQGRDNISRFGLAVSADGLNFQRFNDYIFEGDPADPFERLGVEDARITKLEDTYYIYYTSASVYSKEEARYVHFAPSLSSNVPWRVRVSAMITKDFKTFERKGQVLPGLDSKDAALFSEKIGGQYWLLHRVFPNINLATGETPLRFQDQGVFLTTRSGAWDSNRVGIGAPPLKTEKGWLVFYHAVDDHKIYQVGILLLDLINPRKVLYRSPVSVFFPETSYEKEGYVNNVVFVSAVVEKNGHYLLYYGAADKVIGLAWVNKKDLLESLV